MTFSFNKMLGGILFALVTAIGALTGILFLTGRIPDRGESSSTGASCASDAGATFTGLGRLRARTAPQSDDDAGATVVLRPWFSYSDEGRDFYEELSRKSAAIKDEILSYFSAHTEPELHTLGEESVKAELTTLINEQLVLGQIDTLYFSEYLFIQ